MIFPLVQDFADALAAMPREHSRYRILKLLDEAIRRDAHFIDRHPTTLFQCMWNSCWWLGPQAAEEPVTSFADGKPVAFAPLLESWHRDRQRFGRTGTWLRSLRPPDLPLGSSLRVVIAGPTD